MRWKRLTVKILVYLAVVGWLGGIVFLLGYRARNPIDAYSNSQSQERPTQESVASFQQYDSNPRWKQSDEHQSYAGKVFEPMTILTLFLVFGVGITAYIYWRQLKKMEETVALVGKQGKTMEGQLNSMEAQERAVRETLLQNKRQLDIEIAKTNPRLRVAEVRAENFEVGKRPVFIVTIANDGLIDATDVRLHVGVQMDVDKELNWINDPIVMIPAGGKERYFLLSSSWLEKEHIEGFNNNVPLKVIGHFTHWITGRKDFCYRYQPWDGERPEGVPQFVPCDFEPRLNTAVRISGVELKLTGFAPAMIHRKATPEETKPEKEAKTESEDNREKPN